jgi:hypothetical protein
VPLVLRLSPHGCSRRCRISPNTHAASATRVSRRCRAEHERTHHEIVGTRPADANAAVSQEPSTITITPQGVSTGRPFTRRASPGRSSSRPAGTPDARSAWPASTCWAASDALSSGALTLLASLMLFFPPRLVDPEREDHACDRQDPEEPRGPPRRAPNFLSHRCSIVASSGQLDPPRRGDRTALTRYLSLGGSRARISPLRCIPAIPLATRDCGRRDTATARPPKSTVALHEERETSCPPIAAAGFWRPWQPEARRQRANLRRRKR